MTVFLMNGENMNRKQLAQNQSFIVTIFSIFFLIGVWFVRSDIANALPLVVFHAVLLINTYFSIQCFGRMTPENARGQKVINGFLFLIYLLLPFSFAFASLYILLMLLLFLVASAKYAFLLGVISDTRLLRRKIIVDLSGAAWNYLVFMVGSVGLIPVDVLLWIWVGVFAAMNVYLLKIKPMYCLTTP